MASGLAAGGRPFLAAGMWCIQPFRELLDPRASDCGQNLPVLAIWGFGWYFCLPFGYCLAFQQDIVGFRLVYLVNSAQKVRDPKTTYSDR